LEDVYVPIMSIQIHTENAIEHGIRNNRDGAGWVKISVEHELDRVVVRIEDSGVGRAKSREIKSLGTQYGTQMISDIEQIYNKFNILPISHRYEDDIFMNEQGIRYGTRVIITFPKKFDFKLL
jgi:LytS/YehU family sensor histidine kinase